MVIYLLSLIQTNLLLIFRESLLKLSLAAEFIIFIISCIIGINFVFRPIKLLYKKVGLKSYDIIIIILMIYILFAIYETPGWYMFVYTGKSGGIFSRFRPAYPSFIASFWITLEYAVVILITFLVLKRQRKDD